MSRKYQLPSLTPLECRVLSELTTVGGVTGMTPVALAKCVGLDKSALPLRRVLRRLFLKKCIRLTRLPVPGHAELQGAWAITRRGRKAREQFAANVGLQL
jgi:hypothetical protein